MKMLNKTEKDSKETCKICLATFMNKNELTCHIKEHHKCFKCDICFKEFTLIYNLTRHYKIHTGESHVTCHICNKDIHRTNFKCHLNTHASEVAIDPETGATVNSYSRTTFSCRFCTKTFIDKRSMTRHENCHTREKVWTCSWCPKEFYDSRYKWRHELIHHLDETNINSVNQQLLARNHACTVCEKTYTAACDLKHHMMVHTGDKPFKCTVCNKDFTRKSILNKHMVKHSGEKPYKCNICGKGFKSQYFLTGHLKTHDIDATSDTGQSQVLNLETRHLKTHDIDAKSDTGQSQVLNLETLPGPDLAISPGQGNSVSAKQQLLARNHACTVCEKSYTSALNLKHHMMVHTGDKPNKCLVCNKDFIRKSVLNKHMLKHSGEKPHKCYKCGKGFTRRCFLKGHLKTHDKDATFITGQSQVLSLETQPGPNLAISPGQGNSPSAKQQLLARNHACTVCEKSYTSALNLKHHMMVHTGDKPNKCLVCNKDFIRKSVLNKHMLKHSGEKPHKCYKCGKGFTRRCFLKGHLKTHDIDATFITGQSQVLNLETGHLKTHDIDTTSDTGQSQVLNLETLPGPDLATSPCHDNNPSPTLRHEVKLEYTEQHNPLVKGQEHADTRRDL